MSDATKRKLADGGWRALRTFLQAAVGLFIAISVGPLTAYMKDVANAGSGGDPIIFPTDLVRRALLAGAAAGIVAVVTLLHNWLEDTTPFPTIAKPVDREVGDAALGERGE